jgi:hypothetical protein
MNLRWLSIFLIVLLAVDVSAATNFRKPPVKVVWNTSGDSSVNYAINNYTNNDGGGGYWYEVYSPESDDNGYEWGVIVDLGAVYNITQVRVNMIPGNDDSACSVKLVRIGNSSSGVGEKNVLVSPYTDGWLDGSWEFGEPVINYAQGRYIHVAGGITRWAVTIGNRGCYDLNTWDGGVANRIYEIQYNGTKIETPPRITSITPNSRNVIQGTPIQTSIVITAGDSNFNTTWLLLNGSVSNVRLAKSGTVVSNISTDTLYGNYTLGGKVSDVLGNWTRFTDGSINVYMSGSTNIVMSASGGASVIGANVAIVSQNNTVLANDTIGSNGGNVSTGVVDNYRNVKVRITMPSGNTLVFNKMNISTINKSLTVAVANLTIKPLFMDRISNAVASNASNGQATISINIANEPNRICRCSSWDFGSSLCSSAWSCNASTSYQHKYSGGVFSFNVTHFSAYVVGEAGYNLGVWDDTNDPEGLNTVHNQGKKVGFFANYTNSTDDPITSGYCQIKHSGGFSNMSYNATTKLYYNYSRFANYGTSYFNVTCKNGVNLSVVDNYYITKNSICEPTVCGTNCVGPFFGDQFNTWVYGTDNVTYSDCAGQLSNTYSDYNWAGVTGVDLNCDLSYSPGGVAENATLAANPSLCLYIIPNLVGIGATCPSYDRYGRPITGADCFCYNTTTWGAVNCGSAGIAFSMLNFADPFFAESAGFGAEVGSSSSTWSQIFWYTAENVAHSISYGIYNTTIGCSQLIQYYIEPTPINGVEQKVNASADIDGTEFCQNATQGVMVISNDGSVGINLSAKFSEVPNGIRVKVSRANSGWKDTCADVCDSSNCTLLNDCMWLNSTHYKQISYNLLWNTTAEFWMWADFKGVVGALAPSKGNLTTNATKYNA